MRWLSPATLVHPARIIGRRGFVRIAGDDQLLSACHFTRFEVWSWSALLVSQLRPAAFRNSRQIKGLLTAIFAIGCAEALLALVQVATRAEKIYWFIPTPVSPPCGSFVNYSHFAQFMNLSIGQVWPWSLFVSTRIAA